MNKSWFYLVAVSSLAIVVTSCSGDGDKAAAPNPSPTVAASPAPTATPTVAPTAAAPSTTASPSPTTVTPVAPVTPAPGKGVSVDVAAGLIPNTDPDNWTRTVAKGRPDPFAVLALQTVEVGLSKDLTTQPVKSASASGKPSSKATGSKNKGVKSGVDKPLPEIKVPSNIATKPDNIPAIKPTAMPGSSGQNVGAIPRSGVNKKLPKIVIGTKPTVTTPAEKPANQKPIVAIKPVPAKQKPLIVIKPLPEPIRATPTAAPSKPEPKLAATVGVSGVIQVDGKTQIVVRLPNESFSRYVEVGDRIYDGKITVKRVEGAQTLSPTVVFEEVGVEVNRRVGDPAKGVAEATPAQPTPRLQ